MIKYKNSVNELGEKVLTLYNDDIKIGYIEYSIYESSYMIEIEYIYIEPKYRRKGYMTKLLKHLQKKFIDYGIDVGPAVTDEGKEFVKSIKYITKKHPLYDTYKNEYDNLVNNNGDKKEIRRLKRLLNTINKQYKQIDLR